MLLERFRRFWPILLVGCGWLLLIPGALWVVAIIQDPDSGFHLHWKRGRGGAGGSEGGREGGLDPGGGGGVSKRRRVREQERERHRLGQRPKKRERAAMWQHHGHSTAAVASTRQLCCLSTMGVATRINMLTQYR